MKRWCLKTDREENNKTMSHHTRDTQTLNHHSAPPHTHTHTHTQRMHLHVGILLHTPAHQCNHTLTPVSDMTGDTLSSLFLHLSLPQALCHTLSLSLYFLSLSPSPSFILFPPSPSPSLSPPSLSPSLSLFLSPSRSLSLTLSLYLSLY